MVGKCWFLAGFLAIALVSGQGCGGGQSNQAAANGSGGTKTTGTPSDSVAIFLEAVRTGNDQQAAAMLTPLARQKTSEKNMVVAPPGSATAKFKVGNFEFITPEKDAAHVWCSWTDVTDDKGNTRTDDIIWALRLEPDGWRIAGMVLKVYAGQPPLVLNFEDPDDMLRKQEMLQAVDTEVTAAPPAGAPSQATRTDPAAAQQR